MELLVGISEEGQVIVTFPTLPDNAGGFQILLPPARARAFAELLIEKAREIESLSSVDDGADFSPQRENLMAKTDKPKLVIAILDRGWVFIGRASESSSAIKLSNAACIRRWGTNRGIGQLALEGAQRETKIDEAGTLTVPRNAIIALIDAVDAKWPGR